MVLDAFLVPYTISRSILVSHPNKPPVDQSQYILNSLSRKKNKMLQTGVLKPVNQATPWINSFVLVEGKDKLGNLKLRICLDPTNLNKAIVHEPYHFKTPEDIAHLLAEACVITDVIVEKVIDTSSLMKFLHSWPCLTLS